jgi:hypothetical protein
MQRLRSFVYENSLSLFFGVLLLAALTGQAIAGHDAYNEEQQAHGGEPISLGRYLTSSAFGRAVMENWQSEYLQFSLFIFATIWFLQRGSPESKELGREGLESDEDQKLGRHSSPRSPGLARAGGLRTAIYSNSLLIVMGLIFFGSWFAHSVTGWSEFNSEQLQHGEASISWGSYLGTSTFWEQTLQNWQSEFLAIGSMAVLSIYLRQRGSPESKPVGASHDATGVEG